jgi:hypothetical protein
LFSIVRKLPFVLVSGVFSEGGNGLGGGGGGTTGHVHADNGVLRLLGYSREKVLGLAAIVAQEKNNAMGWKVGDIYTGQAGGLKVS